MLIDVRKLDQGQPVAILGLGHTVLPETDRYDNQRFTLNVLSATGQMHLSHDVDVPEPITLEGWLTAVDDMFVSATGIRTRYRFPGTTAQLGAIAAQACLRDANIQASEIDAIIVGTNTGTGYPSTADLIKGLINASNEAFCCDVQEACPVGAIVVQLGWEKIRSGNYRRVLVIGAERASTLASVDEYKAANLFGDAAFAMMLGPGPEAFLFFESGSDPRDGKSDLIVRTPDGFTQKGSAVHRYVGTVVPTVVSKVLTRLQIDPLSIDHLFPHQPSAKTLDFFLSSIRRQWPGFRAVVHHNVEEMGNTSGACTGWMLSRAKQAGDLIPGQRCLVISFGAGMSWALYGFIVPSAPVR